MSEKKKNILKTLIPTILAVVIMAFVLRVMLQEETQQTPVSTAETTAEIITNEAPAVSINAKEIPDLPTSNPFAGRYVTYQGITNIETGDVTYLINPADNDSDVYMEFVVTEGDATVYSSELIAAGKGIDVDFTQLLSSGEHSLTITMNPYLEVDGDYLKCPVNNAQDITVNM